jgi:hypothetical protein
MEAGVPVDWFALVEVEGETRGAVPVTSAESVTALRMHGTCSSWTELRTGAGSGLRRRKIPIITGLRERLLGQFGQDTKRYLQPD